MPQPRFKPFLQTLGRCGEYPRTIASARGLAAKTSTLESPGDMVICRSRPNAKINRNFEVFTPTDFLAAKP